MAYKVMRKEFVRFQPKWLTRFLFSLPPKIYEAVATLEAARANLQVINDRIHEAHLLDKGHLCLSEEEDSFLVKSGKGRPYVRFFIQHNYYNS